MVSSKKYGLKGSFPDRMLLLAITAALGILPLISACERVGTDLRPAQERKNMELAKDSPSQVVAIPPMDEAAPAHTRTATFALG